MSFRGRTINTSRVSGKREIVACECETETTTTTRACDECQRRAVNEWCWDDADKSRACLFENGCRNIRFHTTYSTGTAGVKGTVALEKGHHHYWEIEMSTEVYGTDMMIGVGTEQTDLGRFKTSFVSLIGKDEHSWGLSYNGTIHHAGESHKYMDSFGQHSVIGVHLNLWAGTLEYYLNRKPMGIAFRNLQNKTLFPMISSTAARSGMNLIFSRSYPSSLELQALLAIGKNMFAPENTSLFKCMELPPGLLRFIKNNYWWISSNKVSEVKGADQNSSATAGSSSSSLKKRYREQSDDLPKLRIIFTSTRRTQSSTRTTRSMAKTKLELAAGPATNLRKTTREKRSKTQSPASSSSSKSMLSPSTSTTTRRMSVVESRNKRRLIDSKNNSDVVLVKKK